MDGAQRDWRQHGVRVVTSERLDFNTPQTPGMTRAAAINRATAGAEKLCAGTVEILPDAKSGAHHHGALESVIYVVSAGRACAGETAWSSWRRQGRETSFTCRLRSHQEINASKDQPLSCILVWSDQEPVVVNLDIPAVEEPEEVRWVDPMHPG